MQSVYTNPLIERLKDKMADTETPADAKRERPDDETTNGASAADDGKSNIKDLK